MSKVRQESIIFLKKVSPPALKNSSIPQAFFSGNCGFRYSAISLVVLDDRIRPQTLALPEPP
jgi:hypothetical protein